jgi:hypothetical protein
VDESSEPDNIDDPGDGKSYMWWKTDQKLSVIPCMTSIPDSSTPIPFLKGETNYTEQS